MDTGETSNRNDQVNANGNFERENSNYRPPVAPTGCLNCNNEANQSIRTGTNTGYEEFFGGSIQCPSCRGTGRISRESDNELLALIPVSDKRLRPRRTTLYVVLSIIICCSVAGLLVFFLYPRGFSVSSHDKNLIPSLLYINTSKSIVEMTVTNKYNITNPNFFAMDVTQLNGQVFFDQRIMGKAINNTVLHIPMRSKKEHFLTFNITFEGDEGYIAYYCSEGPRFGHTILMPFDTKITATSFWRTEETTISSYQHVRCSPKYVKTTTKAPTTTVTVPTVSIITTTKT